MYEISAFLAATTPKAPAKARAKAPKFAIGMAVIYCGKPAVITGKEGRVWLVECDGAVWPSRGKDMRPAK